MACFEFEEQFDLVLKCALCCSASAAKFGFVKLSLLSVGLSQCFLNMVYALRTSGVDKLSLFVDVSSIKFNRCF